MGCGLVVCVVVRVWTDLGACPLNGLGPGWIRGGVLRGFLAASLLCPGPHTGGVLLRKLRGFSSQFWGLRSG